jgi:glycosyltransferase involved in cell wall biosynthesis
MVAAFRQMEAAGLGGWEYHCVGGLRDTPAHRAYFERLGAQGSGGGVRLAANLGRGELKRLFERASIFWHASGYGHDEDADPVRAEHFGISTAEAMAAGCVPVVVNRGGQREIVEHGVSGFLWETLEELKDYTGRLVADDALRSRMSEAARARAARFSREAFAENYLRRLITAPTPAGVSAGGI